MRCMVLAWAALAALVASPSPPPAQSIVTLRWMAGSWTGREGAIEMEELWTAPKGGSMLGLHRDVREGRTTSFEFLRIEERDGGLVYLASPGGRPATPFPLVEAREHRAVFANPQHDYPQRILYWLDAEGALHARIEGTIAGQPASEQWRWTREPLL